MHRTNQAFALASLFLFLAALAFTLAASADYISMKSKRQVIVRYRYPIAEYQTQFK